MMYGFETEYPALNHGLELLRNRLSHDGRLLTRANSQWSTTQADGSSALDERLKNTATALSSDNPWKTERRDPQALAAIRARIRQLAEGKKRTLAPVNPVSDASTVPIHAQQQSEHSVPIAVVDRVAVEANTPADDHNRLSPISTADNLRNCQLWQIDAVVAPHVVDECVQTEIQPHESGHCRDGEGDVSPGSSTPPTHAPATVYRTMSYPLDMVKPPSGVSDRMCSRTIRAVARQLERTRSQRREEIRQILELDEH